MGLLAKIKSIFRQAPELATSAPGALRTYNYNLLTAPAPLGLKIATVYRCVKLLADAVAQMPLSYQAKRGGVYEPTDEYSLNYLLGVSADTWQSSYSFKFGIVTEVQLSGNAFVIPVFNPATATYDRLVLCSRGSVQHKTESDTYEVNDKISGLCGTFTEEEVIHIKGMPSQKNPKSGVSVLEYASSAIEIAGAGDQETSRRFSTGGNLKGILKNALTGRGLDGYDEDQMRELGEQIRQQIDAKSAVIVTPTDTDFQQINMTSADMEFLATRKFSVREICRFFGVHPSFVFDDTSNNYKSAENANSAFLSHTLNPLLAQIENEFQRKLIGPRMQQKRRISFDRRGVYALDLSGMSDYYTKMLAIGAMTINEIRARENMPAIEGGDKVLISANLRSIEEVTTNPTGTSQPTDNGNEKE